jgi:type IV fimbrial biogenesis protein FimT
VKDSHLQSNFQILSQPPRYESGLSLYETLVTLIVISLISSMAIPAYQQFISSTRISSSVNSLVTALHTARSEAIKRNERAVLCPSLDGRICRSDSAGDTAWEDGYMVFVDHNANHELDAEDSVVWLSGAQEGIQIRSTASRDHVTYLPSGMAIGTNLTFTFCDKRGGVTPRAVIVSNSGRPRTSARDANGRAIVCPTAS